LKRQEQRQEPADEGDHLVALALAGRPGTSIRGLARRDGGQVGAAVDAELGVRRIDPAALAAKPLGRGETLTADLAKPGAGRIDGAAVSARHPTASDSPSP
jgi:hypothetical protein